MFVCASTECFPDLSPQEVLEAMVDLGFTSIELPIHHTGSWLKPEDVHADLERASTSAATPIASTSPPSRSSSAPNASSTMPSSPRAANWPRRPRSSR